MKSLRARLHANSHLLLALSFVASAMSLGGCGMDKLGEQGGNLAAEVDDDPNEIVYVAGAVPNITFAQDDAFIYSLSAPTEIPFTVEGPRDPLFKVVTQVWSYVPMGTAKGQLIVPAAGAAGVLKLAPWVFNNALMGRVPVGNAQLQVLVSVGGSAFTPYKSHDVKVIK